MKVKEVIRLLNKLTKEQKELRLWTGECKQSYPTLNASLCSIIDDYDLRLLQDCNHDYYYGLFVALKMPTTKKEKFEEGIAEVRVLMSEFKPRLSKFSKKYLNEAARKNPEIVEKLLNGSD